MHIASHTHTITHTEPPEFFNPTAAGISPLWLDTHTHQVRLNTFVLMWATSIWLPTHAQQTPVVLIVTFVLSRQIWIVTYARKPTKFLLLSVADTYMAIPTHTHWMTEAAKITISSCRYSKDMAAYIDAPKLPEFLVPPVGFPIWLPTPEWKPSKSLVPQIL